MDSTRMYGMSMATGGGPGISAPTATLSGDADASGIGWLVSPRNPLMIFGLLLLVTVGAAGVAGSVRLGPAKISAAVGKS